MLVEWTGPADAEARYASSRRADVPELARQAALAHGHGAGRSEKICWCTLSGGPPVMERDHLLESSPTSPLPSRVLEAVPDLTRVPWKP
mgnify:CR=1 FL=1